jgi:serine/threonine protein kinase
MIIPLGTVIGKYELIKLLGQGSFGTVYKAKDVLLNRTCAIKFVQNQNPAQFIAHYEAQILHKVRHERVVNVHSVDKALLSGIPFALIDMEFCSDGSADHLVATEFVSIRRAVKILVDVLFGLDHAVRQGVLHRDIKPANIMCFGNRYKIGDFGLASDGGSVDGLVHRDGPALSGRSRRCFARSWRDCKDCRWDRSRSGSPARRD